MPSATIGKPDRHLRSTQRLWPKGRHAISTIAIAILVRLALACAGGYLSFNGDLGAGPAGRLGLVLVGPCLAAALWCLMVEQLARHLGFASQEGRYSISGLLSWSLHEMTEVPANECRAHPGCPDPAATERIGPEVSKAASERSRVDGFGSLCS
jgi:hypothetical protein